MVFVATIKLNLSAPQKVNVTKDVIIKY
jgi:hypothetical protein